MDKYIQLWRQSNSNPSKRSQSASLSENCDPNVNSSSTKQLIDKSSSADENHSSSSANLQNFIDSDVNSLSKNESKNQSVDSSSSTDVSAVERMTPPLTTSSRHFIPKWATIFTWLHYDECLQKAFCSTCTEAYTVLKIKCPNNGAYDEKSYNAFIINGFSNWKRANEKFRTHEQSNVHRNAVYSIITRTKQANVSELLSEKCKQDRKEARNCLLKIIESIKFLAIQGLPLRGHTEDHSNFIQLLHLRSGDNSLLKSWMQRSKYKWISHDIMNEIVTLMSLDVQKKLLLKISQPQFYAIMGDETTDISRKEQMSFNFRVVDDNLLIHEYFMGFYDVPATDADTLFKVVKDVLLRFQLPICKCRGQCYDGASNVSGSITGLQTRFRKDEPRALYSHCAGHNINLVSQDGMKKIPEIADLLSNIRELVTFIRASAKRNNILNEIKSQMKYDEESNDPGESLKPFCPTRWCVRVKSLKSVKDNFREIIDFCDVVGLQSDDSGVKARGFSTYLNKFETFILLQIAITTLEKVEALNETLQATSITFKSVIKRVGVLKSSLNSIRTDEKFNELWDLTDISVKRYDLDNKEPELPRKRKIPKRFDNNTSTAYFPPNAKDKFRRIYFEVIDQIIMSIDIRFNAETYKILSKMEDFATIKCDIDEIKQYLYKDQQCDFDLDRLVLHRNMFYDVLKEKKIDLAPDLSQISIFLQENVDIREFCSEFTKYIKLLLNYPQTVVIAERSFSSLKRLKNYLSHNMTQQRTNDLAILHCHREITEEISLDVIADEFIRRNVIRSNTFASKSEM